MVESVTLLFLKVIAAGIIMDVFGLVAEILESSAEQRSYIFHLIHLLITCLFNWCLI